MATRAAFLDWLLDSVDKGILSPDTATAFVEAMEEGHFIDMGGELDIPVYVLRHVMRIHDGTSATFAEVIEEISKGAKPWPGTNARQGHEKE